MSVLCVRELGLSMRCQQCYDCANNNESSSVPVDCLIHTRIKKPSVVYLGCHRS
jgi:hypothetical protein